MVLSEPVSKTLLVRPMREGYLAVKPIKRVPYDGRRMILGCLRKSGEASGRQCAQCVLRK